MLAEILDQEFLEHIHKLCKDCNLLSIGCVSGGFDPIHPGHISNITEAKRYCSILVVIVNSDQFLINKKGNYFMSQKDRCKIISGIKEVDYVYPFNPINSNDMSVVEALEYIKPNCFCKGGDKGHHNIPEVEVCKELGIKIINNVGDAKEWSSTDYLMRWGEFYKAHKTA